MLQCVCLFLTKYVSAIQAILLSISPFFKIIIIIIINSWF